MRLFVSARTRQVPEAFRARIAFIFSAIAWKAAGVFGAREWSEYYCEKSTTNNPLKTILAITGSANKRLCLVCWLGLLWCWMGWRCYRNNLFFHSHQGD